MVEYHARSPATLDQPALNRLLGVPSDAPTPRGTKSFEGDLTVALMPAAAFLNGWRFYEDRPGAASAAPERVVAVHHNWISGDESKWRRATEFDALVTDPAETREAFLARTRASMRTRPKWVYVKPGSRRAQSSKLQRVTRKSAPLDAGSGAGPGSATEAGAAGDTGAPGEMYTGEGAGAGAGTGAPGVECSIGVGVGVDSVGPDGGATAGGRAAAASTGGDAGTDGSSGSSGAAVEGVASIAPSGFFARMGCCKIMPSLHPPWVASGLTLMCFCRAFAALRSALVFERADVNGVVAGAACCADSRDCSGLRRGALAESCAPGVAVAGRFAVVCATRTGRVDSVGCCTRAVIPRSSRSACCSARSATRATRARAHARHGYGSCHAQSA